MLQKYDFHSTTIMPQKYCNFNLQGFFSKFLMGGLKLFGPRRGRSQMGGDLRKKSD